MTEAASGYDRLALEKYYTPEWAIRAVIEHMSLSFSDVIYDPAAGDGAVLRTAWAMGHVAHGADILPDAPGIAQVDFLGDHTPRRVVLTNPPYGGGGGLACKFIRHALAVTQASRGKVAMLLRADFDSGSTRVDIFRDHPAFVGRVVLMTRVRWTNFPDTPGKGPSQNHTWFCWDWSKPASVLPVVRYAS